ncbi:unnamed protein product [Candidula unifasciata]|uniref:HTH La-type RNA-binding domain-containing protein n=1 Tax=Candidula unifasciata TaxID=100452 RepID=A0A8S3ZJK2_9EUPU|nr:unnamed protein product [Candidula unifasciata]
MAAASAVKDEPSETGHGENQNNLPLKVEGNQDCFKTTMAVERQGLLADTGKTHEKCDKSEQSAKKFVDAPLPTTNPWTKRSSSLTLAAETNLNPQIPDFKKAPQVNAVPQVNAAPHVNAVPQGNGAPQMIAAPQKGGRGGGKTPASNIESVKNEKPKSQKSKTELNGNKQAENSQKPKIKKFGEDYVEAPLPTVNPWKKPVGANMASGLVIPARVEQDPTPAAAVVVSPVSFSKELWSVEKTFQADLKKDVMPLEIAANETEPKKAASPALVDDSWPTLHEVKVPEPNQTMPPKATKSPRVKATPASSTTVSTTPTEIEPVVSGIASAPVTTSIDVSPALLEHTGEAPVETQTVQTQTQTDSGGDDSSKENKETSGNDDDTSNAVRSKKGTKPKWQRMEIEHPKPDRRNRRSRSQGRGFSPPRRGGRPAGDRFNRPNRRSEAGPDSQNWRANMIPQTDNTATDPVVTPTTDTDNAATTDAAHTTINTGDHARGGPGMNFTGNRNPRGRGAPRGNGLRRGGGRGRGGVRETKSPPFQANPHSWNHEPVFPVITQDQETIQVPWSQGFNRVHSIPRVPPINPAVMLGMEANLFLQEQIMNLLGQASVYYDVTSNTYPAPSETLKHQVEYYFSEHNLVKDTFLRKKMDKQGWVELELVLSFNKVKALNADYKSLIQAIRFSDKLELSEHEDYVRTLNCPESWPIEPDVPELLPPVEIQRVAAMSTLHSDAPEFIPGKPFVLRNLASSVPVTKEDDVVPNSESQDTPTEEQDSLVGTSASASSLATVPPMLSSR